MNIVTAYVLKCILVSGVLVMYYYLALRNKKFNYYNRFYLLAAVVCSLIMPLINFNWFIIKGNDGPILSNVLVIINNPQKYQQQPHPSVQWFLCGAIFIISLVLCITLAAKIAWILRIKHNNKNTQIQGVNLIETTVKQAPFSFLNNLFWKKGISLNDSNGEKIFRHELTHIRQRHTHDKLFTQVVMCIFWINPFYWFIQRELNMIHEFIADGECIADGDVESFARMLLQAHNEGRYLNPSHSFFHSPIKRRLIMITTSGKTPYSYARRVLVLPVITAIAALFSITISKAQTDPKKGGDPIKIDKVTLNKKSSGKAAGDSVVDVIVFYKNKYGKKDTLHFKNVKFDGSQHHPERDSIRDPENKGKEEGSASTNSAQGEVKRIETIDGCLTVYLKNGETEKYALNDDAAIKKFTDKYGLALMHIPVAGSVTKINGTTVISPGSNDNKGDVQVFSKQGDNYTPIAAQNNNNSNLNIISNVNAGVNNGVSVTSISPQSDFVKVISTADNKIKLDSISVKSLKISTERAKILTKYGIE